MIPHIGSTNIRREHSDPFITSGSVDALKLSDTDRRWLVGTELTPYPPATMNPTTPRLLSFWTTKPQITLEAIRCQLLINEIRDRGPLNRNRRRKNS